MAGTIPSDSEGSFFVIPLQNGIYDYSSIPACAGMTYLRWDDRRENTGRRASGTMTY